MELGRDLLDHQVKSPVIAVTISHHSLHKLFMLHLKSSFLPLLPFQNLMDVLHQNHLIISSLRLLVAS